MTTRRPRIWSTDKVFALPPEQGIPVLVGILAYPTFLVYKSTAGSSKSDAAPLGTEEEEEAATGGSIGRALKWSKLLDAPSPPFVKMCVGQDCTKDGAPQAWDLVREVAPAGVAVVPVNCLGPCGKGPCGQAYAAGPDPGRACPLVLSPDDGFYDDDRRPPSPAVLPSGLVKPRVAAGRERRTKAFLSTEIKSPADARVLFRGMGYDDSELCGGRGFGVRVSSADDEVDGRHRRRSRADVEVLSTRQGFFDINRLDNILLQRIGYALLFIFVVGRFQLDDGADIVVPGSTASVPVWFLALAFFGATQIISVDPDENTYRPPKDDLEHPIPYSSQ